MIQQSAVLLDQLSLGISHSKGDFNSDDIVHPLRDLTSLCLSEVALDSVVTTLTATGTPQMNYDTPMANLTLCL